MKTLITILLLSGLAHASDEAGCKDMAGNMNKALPIKAGGAQIVQANCDYEDTMFIVVKVKPNTTKQAIKPYFVSRICTEQNAGFDYVDQFWIGLYNEQGKGIDTISITKKDCSSFLYGSR